MSHTSQHENSGGNAASKTKVRHTVFAFFASAKTHGMRWCLLRQQSPIKQRCSTGILAAWVFARTKRVPAQARLYRAVGGATPDYLERLAGFRRLIDSIHNDSTMANGTKRSALPTEGKVSGGANKKRRANGVQKFYGVLRGRKPGVYMTWDDVKAQVDGFKGSLRKWHPFSCLLFSSR